jgi:hypothetical protein
MKMLIKSNKGSNCIPPLRNSINDENFDDIVYGDEDKCFNILWLILSGPEALYESIIFKISTISLIVTKISFITFA